MTLRDSQPRPEGSELRPGPRDDGGEGVGPSGGIIEGRLRLRGAARTRQRVTWVEDTVDNEGMGKKKTKSAHYSFLCISKGCELIDIAWCSLLYLP